MPLFLYAVGTVCGILHSLPTGTPAMTDPIFTKAELAMSKWQFFNHLSARRERGEMSPSSFGRLFDAWLEHKRNAKASKLSKAQHKRWWQRLLRPLKYEAHNVRAGLKFIRVNGRDEPEKQEFLLAYLSVLEALLKKFHLAQCDGDTTPRELAKEINAAYRRKGWETDRVPNGGEHWTDWVPRSQQLPIFELLGKIPYRKHATVREPFKRTMPPAMAAAARVAMKEMLQKKRDALKNELAEVWVDTDSSIGINEINAAIARVDAALYALDRLKPNAFVPHTTGWPRLLGEEPTSDDED